MKCPLACTLFNFIYKAAFHRAQRIDFFLEYRGNGTGKECAKVLLRWVKENGALYAELNYGSNDRRLRFWKGIGFIENGVDEWADH